MPPGHDAKRAARRRGRGRCPGAYALRPPGLRRRRPARGRVTPGGRVDDRVPWVAVAAPPSSPADDGRPDRDAPAPPAPRPGAPSTDEQLLLAIHRLGDLLEDTRGMLGVLADRVADLAADPPPASGAPAVVPPSTVPPPAVGPAPAAPRRTPSRPPAPQVPTVPSSPDEPSAPARPAPPEVLADHVRDTGPDQEPGTAAAPPTTAAGQPGSVPERHPERRPRPTARRSSSLTHRGPHPEAPAGLADHLRAPGEPPADADDAEDRGSAPG